MSTLQHSKAWWHAMEVNAVCPECLDQMHQDIPAICMNKLLKFAVLQFLSL